MAIAAQYGTATITSSSGGPGEQPYVDVTSTLTHTTAYIDTASILTGVRDVIGDITIESSRVNATTVRFSASRQLPAGEEIVFRWGTVDGSA